MTENALDTPVAATFTACPVAVRRLPSTEAWVVLLISVSDVAAAMAAPNEIETAPTVDAVVMTGVVVAVTSMAPEATTCERSRAADTVLPISFFAVDTPTEILTTPPLRARESMVAPMIDVSEAATATGPADVRVPASAIKARVLPRIRFSEVVTAALAAPPIDTAAAALAVDVSERIVA